MSRPALGPIQDIIYGYRPFFFREKGLLGYKVKHSPLFSAEIKNEWSYTSISPTCFDDLDRENVNFSLISRKENTG
jgi:hypothetical protein